MQAAARVLFVIVGVVWVVIGALTPTMSESSLGKRTLFVTADTDTALFGAAPQDLLASRTDLHTLRQVLLRVIGGLLVGAGLLIAGLAWFGLRTPSTWVLGLLTGAGLVVIPFWWMAFAPYRSAGVSLPLAGLPPFIWIETLLMPVAAILGWVARAKG